MEQVRQFLENRVEAAPANGETSYSRTAGLLMDIKLQVRVLFGSTNLRLADVLKLASGSLVELDRSPDDIVELVVNDRVIARGQVVVIEGCYGIRVTEILTRKSDTSDDLANLFQSLGR